jgi:hypothetical protein
MYARLFHKRIEDSGVAKLEDSQATYMDVERYASREGGGRAASGTNRRG